MGAWGYKALESDAGFDVLDFIKENIPQNYEFELSEIIALMKENGFLAKNEIDFFYDNSAIALTEFYFMFKDNEKFNFPKNDDDDGYSKFNVIKAFTANGSSLDYLLKCLLDIKNKVADEDGEREIILLWRDSKSWEEWQNHLNELINKLKKEV